MLPDLALEGFWFQISDFRFWFQVRVRVEDIPDLALEGDTTRSDGDPRASGLMPARSTIDGEVMPALSPGDPRAAFGVKLQCCSTLTPSP